MTRQGASGHKQHTVTVDETRNLTCASPSPLQKPCWLLFHFFSQWKSASPAPSPLVVALTAGTRQESQMQRTRT